VKRFRPAVVSAVIAAIVLAGCGSDNKPSPAGKVLKVVTTTTQITDFSQNIGGADVKVYAVLKANVDPHDYEPTPADLDAIAKADVIVQNGVGLEKWFEDTIKNANPKGTLVDASQGVAIRGGNGTAEEAAGDYTAKLDTLDTHVAAQINTLTNKKLVTNHDAFGYYVDRYGLEFVGSVIPSFDSQAELSPTDILNLVAKIKTQGVKAVFSESSLPPKTAEAIAKEAGVQVVNGGDALYGDTLGPPGSDGDTYLKMVEHNTKAIVDNLK
jgi:ABC-type Zn uptake system ZnuABC Zn-binding protein ZnuA